MKARGAWIDTLYAAVGKHIHLETSDGIVREGKMTGIRTKDVLLDQQPQSIVIELELNGDPTDTVPMGIISSITIDRVLV